MTPPLLRPDWVAPPGVHAVMTLRGGGVGTAPYDSFNLSVGVGDDAWAVAENRARLRAAVGAPLVWPRLVHGATVLRLHAGCDEHPETPADAAWTSDTGVACLVTAADCLPVFMALRNGSAVAVAHAGWRGLAAGVLQATVHAVCDGTGAAPDQLQAWLGPCIGPRQFEVGADVLQGFGADAAGSPAARHFMPRSQEVLASPRWLADLRGLAGDALRGCGVRQIGASRECTVEDRSRFFSYRRDRITGRHAAVIWRG